MKFDEFGRFVVVYDGQSLLGWWSIVVMVAGVS